MLLDKGLQFSDDVAVIGSGVVNSSIIDIDSARDIAKGQDVYLKVVASTKYTVKANIAVRVKLSQSNSATFASGVTDVGTFEELKAADLSGSGKGLQQALPLEKVSRRYLRLTYTPVTAPGGGKISAYLTTHTESESNVKSGYNISIT